MKRQVAAATLGSLLIALTGCDSRSMPGAPTDMAPAPAPPVTTPHSDAGFPAATGVVYGRTSPSSIPGNQRYVLRDDGTFSLQYVRPDAGFFEYAGRYTRAGTLVTLLFAANSGQWVAQANLDGDFLVVRYNMDMMLSDFEDGTYVRSTAGSAAEKMAYR